LAPSKHYLGQEIENIIEICNEVMRKIPNDTILTTIIKDDLERYKWIESKIRR
jgi:hypothetical protein